MTKFVVSGLVALSLTLAASFAAAETAPTTVRIGAPSQVGPTGKPQLAVAIDFIDTVMKKDFAGSGTTIEWVAVPGAGPGVNEALAGGRIDFAFYGDFPAIIGKAGGLKTKMILGGIRASNSYLMVPPSSTATSIKDIKGKRLAVNKGRPWNLAFSQLLVTNGFTESDFQVFDLDPGQATAALASGNLEAAYMPLPFGIMLEDKKIGKIIWSTRDLPMTWKFMSSIFVTEDFAKSYPETTQKVVNDFVEAYHYAGLPEHREEIVRMNVTPGGTYELSVKEYEGLTFRDMYTPDNDPYVVAHYKEAVAYMAEHKMIRSAFSVDDWIDEHYVDAAKKSLHLENFWPGYDAEGKSRAAPSN